MADVNVIRPLYLFLQPVNHVDGWVGGWGAVLKLTRRELERERVQGIVRMFSFFLVSRRCDTP